MTPNLRQHRYCNGNNSNHNSIHNSNSNMSSSSSSYHHPQYHHHHHHHQQQQQHHHHQQQQHKTIGYNGNNVALRKQQQLLMRQRPRKIRFADMAELYEFDDYGTPERTRACWYSRDDYVRFERNKQVDLRALRRVRNNVNLINHSRHCERGLESRMTKKAFNQLMHRRFSLVSAVLQEQYTRTYYYGSTVADNEEALAAIASQASYPSVMEALERGIAYGLQNMASDRIQCPSAKRHKRSWSLDLEYEAEPERAGTVGVHKEDININIDDDDDDDDDRDSQSVQHLQTDSDDCQQRNTEGSSTAPRPTIPLWQQFLVDIFQSAPIEASVKPADSPAKSDVNHASPLATATPTVCQQQQQRTPQAIAC